MHQQQVSKQVKSEVHATAVAGVRQEASRELANNLRSDSKLKDELKGAFSATGTRNIHEMADKCGNAVEEIATRLGIQLDERDKVGIQEWLKHTANAVAETSAGNRDKQARQNGAKAANPMAQAAGEADALSEADPMANGQAMPYGNRDGNLNARSNPLAHADPVARMTAQGIALEAGADKNFERAYQALESAFARMYPDRALKSGMDFGQAFDRLIAQREQGAQPGEWITEAHHAAVERMYDPERVKRAA